MLEIKQNYPLKNNTTFGVEISCDWFSEPADIDQLSYLLNYAEEWKLKTMTIGEGSNFLFVSKFKGLIIHPCIHGIEKREENDDEVLVNVGAGVIWDEFVAWAVENNYFGAENLSNIPGSVGAVPVQNIGAYGREAKDIVVSVDAYDSEKKEIVTFTNADCTFGYRDSIFKHYAPGRYIVTHVLFRLQKNGELLLDYGNVKEQFQKEDKQDLSTLRSTIINIRNSKLPDYKEVGNGGSYFKNPIISDEEFAKLSLAHENIPHYPAGPGKVKVPAGWLIERSGWKGIREGDTGTWPTQALVIVNYGNASGEEIFNFSEKIRLDIQSKFNISLEREVLVIL